MKKIIAAAAIFLASTSVQAAEKMNCPELGQIAHMMMKQRQSGMLVSDMMNTIETGMAKRGYDPKGETVKFYQRMILDAFSTPAYSGAPSVQAEAAIDFANEWASWCYSEFGF